MQIWKKQGTLTKEARHEILDIIYSALDDLDIPEIALKGLWINNNLQAKALVSRNMISRKYPGLHERDILGLLGNPLSKQIGSAFLFCSFHLTTPTITAGYAELEL